MIDKEKWLSCTDLEQYRIMKRHYQQTNADVANITGNTKESVEVVTTSKNFPRWLKYALHNFAIEQGYIE